MPASAAAGANSTGISSSGSVPGSTGKSSEVAGMRCGMGWPCPIGSGSSSKGVIGSAIASFATIGLGGRFCKCPRRDFRPRHFFSHWWFLRQRCFIHPGDCFFDNWLFGRSLSFPDGLRLLHGSASNAISTGGAKGSVAGIFSLASGSAITSETNSVSLGSSTRGSPTSSANDSSRRRLEFFPWSSRFARSRPPPPRAAMAPVPTARPFLLNGITARRKAGSDALSCNEACGGPPARRAGVAKGFTAPTLSSSGSKRGALEAECDAAR